MDRIEIELGMWESAPCPICTKNVDLEKAEKMLYESVVSNFRYTKEQIEDFITNDNYRGDGWTQEWEDFQELLCAEEESIVIECGGVYYEDMTEEEYNAVTDFVDVKYETTYFNRTPYEIKQLFYKWYETRGDIREMIRCYLSKVLMDTSEEKPIEVNIAVEEGCVGLSTNDMHKIVAIWQHPSEGWITCKMNYGADVDLDEFETSTLVEIMDFFDRR